MSEGINLTDIPIRLAEGINVDVFCGGLICSLILMLILVLPMVIVVRGKHGSLFLEVGAILMIMGICIGIGWLPIWFLLIIALVSALMISDFMKRRRKG